MTIIYCNCDFYLVWEQKCRPANGTKPLVGFVITHLVSGVIPGSRLYFGAPALILETRQ